VRGAGHVLIALAIAACRAPAPPSKGCPTGDVQVRTQADLDGLAGCAAVSGALVIRTAAPIDLRPLGTLESVGGDLSIGPTLALTGIDGFGKLRAIGGALRISANPEVTGAYFPALERAGSVWVDGNGAMTEWLAPALARVAGDVTVSHNGALEIVDLGALIVAGHITFEDNRKLGSVHVPALGT
jgi:hypothetical protein